MKILHYALGFPPYRSGGMTTYCMNLICEQVKAGHDVGLLWPGEYYFGKTKTKIKTRSKYQFIDGTTCNNYEIVDGLPVPLLNGVLNTKAFSRKIDEKIFTDFFVKQHIDVLHVHSLMGLPVECILAANKLGVKTILTTHDYYGLCFKWGFFVNGSICLNNEDCKKCVECNKTGLSLVKISVLQSALYRNVKNSWLVKKLRQNNNNNLNASNAVMDVDDSQRCEGLEKDYVALRNYYVKLIEAFGLVQYNSTLTKEVYQRYVKPSKSVVINVTHTNIHNNIRRKITNNTVNIGYLGPQNQHKGYYFIKQVLDEIYKEGIDNFAFHVFTGNEPNAKYEIVHQPYKYNELSDVMKELDLVVVPSQWYETFGFTALEALSFGVPALVTNNVGAKDIIENARNGYVIDSDIEAWKRMLIELIEFPEQISIMNEYIVQHPSMIVEFNDHVKEILHLYTNV